MSEILHDTFVIVRRYPKSPVEVFTALSDPGLKRRWFAFEGAETFESDFRVGGVERYVSRMGPETPFPGTELASEGRHLDIVPERRVVVSAVMTLGGRPISAAQVTYEVKEDGDGAELIFTHQAAFFEGSDGPQMRQAGWEAMLDALGRTLIAEPA